MKFCRLLTAASCLICLTSGPLAHAQLYFIPAGGGDVVGETYRIVIDTEETLADVARQHNVGHEEIRNANPTVEFWLPPVGAQVILPKRHILPRAKREGIVLNVPEMRLYYFPEPCTTDRECMLITHPVSIGRMDWQTPLGTTHVTAKVTNPTWRPPDSIRREAEEQGIHLPAQIPPGPNNPLGAYALYLGLPGYRIHGTNRPYGVGMRSTHGCVRMYPEDIEVLFREIPIGTPVQIVSQPVKFGWTDDTLFMEAHPPLEEDVESRSHLKEIASAALQEVVRGKHFALDESAFQRGLEELNGMPVAISANVPEQ